MPETKFDRRRFLYATGIAGATVLAGCSASGDESGDGGDGSDGDTSGGDGSDDGDGGSGGDGGDRSYLDEEPDYGGWLDDANNYDEGTVDMTDQDAVTITVGYESTAFDPAAVAVSSGTEVTWEWNGQGGSHDVVSQNDGPLESGSSDEEGHTYSYTFEESGTYNYSCTPHEAMGMKGAVYVE